MRGTPDFANGGRRSRIESGRGPRELEGVVAKRRNGRYRPGERGWVKTKNRSYWRWEMERESALNRPRVKQFV